MNRKVGIGIQDFEKIREYNCFYIDKTSFIKEWWESGDIATVIMRPRRFGKTLSMSMLEKFFSFEYAGRDDLFEGLSIWNEEKYRNLQGRYPVINLTFANVKEINFKNASYCIRQILAREYAKYHFLEDVDIFSIEGKEHFKQMLNGMREEDVPKALYYLSYYLYRYYGKKVIILLDEYDTPVQEAHFNGYLNELTKLMESFFDFTFRKNQWIERGIMIGITKIEFVVPELINFKTVSYLSDQYATAFGFTQEEVFTALEQYEMEEEKEKVKYWYDGFRFGRYHHIYNPWCISNFLVHKRYGHYWTNTSSDSFVGKLIREGNRQIKVSFEKLLKGESIWCYIEGRMFCESWRKDENAVWELLVISGYMKILSYNRINKSKIIYEVSFTNFEVKRMFWDTVRKWFGCGRGDYLAFIKAMCTGKIKDMREYFGRVIGNTYHLFCGENISKSEEVERFYYSLVLGLMVDLHQTHRITTNHDGGFDRYVVLLEPLSKADNALILEFKNYDEEKGESLKEVMQSAFSWIEEKQYAKQLEAKGLLKDKIYTYVFAFNGMKVRIEKGRRDVKLFC